LEGRVLLSGATPSVELFDASAAVFVENQGQWADQGVRYAFDGAGCAIGFRDEGLDFRLSGGEQEGAGAAFSLRFEGANRVEPAGEDRAETVFNYFVGEQGNWRSNVAGYGAVAYEGLYAGVDLRMSGRRGAMKYEFHVAPGGEYRQIQLRYDGIGGLSVGEDGSLVVDLGEGLGKLVDDTPVIYQEIDGRRVEVAGRFVVVGASSYGFEVTGAWDAGRELVIDPELAWSTYLGGSKSDEGLGIAVDGWDNVLVTGETFSFGWTSGGYDTSSSGVTDAFVAKLSPSGGHLWSSYVGGNREDTGKGIAVDAWGNVLMTGETFSPGWTRGGFDTSFNGVNSDAFVAKLSPSGGHLWSTYVGGSSDDEGSGIAVDGSGNVLVTGGTTSSGWTSGGFDTSFNGGYSDAFVARLSGSGGHLWSTYLGGSYDDYGTGIAVDGSGNVLVTGGSFSESWTSGGFDTIWDGGADAFVAKLSLSGGYLWSTYLGGIGNDVGNGIGVDGSGNVLVMGETGSSGWTSDGFDIRLDGGMDGFVGKLSPSGEHLWSTYLGGSSYDGGSGIAVDSSGNVLVTGDTKSSSWFDTSFNGVEDAFVVKLSPSGSPLWGIYVGGYYEDYGTGIAVDGSGNVLVTGYTESSDWTSGGFDTSYNDGRGDAFVAKISDGNVNRSPTDMSLSNGSVLENQAAGTAVGTLSTVDPDTGDTFTYTLESGDVAAFTIMGDTLKTAAAFDHEAKNSYSIRIRSTDLGGLWTEKDFVVSVTDVSEPAIITYGVGNWVINIDLGLGSPDATVNVTDGALVLFNVSQHIGTLNITDATVKLAAGGDKLLQLSTLAVFGNGVLDLGDNDMIVTNGDIAVIGSAIKSGRGGGAWSGFGITSSAAKSDEKGMTGLGVRLNDQGEVIVKYTWNGDANLDGVVNADDYFLIDSNFIPQAKGYQNGDFNYDGVINADDYFLIDSAFLGQSGPLGVVEDAVVMRTEGMVGVFAAGRVKRVWEELSEGV